MEELQQLGGMLTKRLHSWLQHRETVEDRWLRNLRQYNGLYDEGVLAEIKKREGSEAFFNITRPRTNSLHGRLADLLLPTDENNWDAQPTPEPESKEAVKSAKPATDPATGQPLTDGQGQQVSEAMVATAYLEEVKKGVEKMREKMRDQLIECDWNAAQRDGLLDGCILGTAVFVGPEINYANVKRYERVGNDVVSRKSQVKRPTFCHVSPWDFVPDPQASKVQDCEGVFLRRLMTRKQLRQIAKGPAMTPAQIEIIAEIITAGPQRSVGELQQREAEMRAMVGQDAVAEDTSFEVWRYIGALDPNTLEGAGLINGDDDPLRDAENVCVWMCNGKVFKADPLIVDSDRLPIYVWSPYPDRISVFGYGQPDILRNSQAMVNGWVRMIMDHADRSVGPQIIIRRDSIVPADGKFTLRGSKIWYMSDDATGSLQDMFRTEKVESNLQWMLEGLKLALQMADEETQALKIEQGDSGNTPQQTATQAQLGENRSMAPLRRIVKTYDDQVTDPAITALYDFNMDYGQDPSMKYDATIHATGSSVLWEKQSQLQNLNDLMSYALNPATEIYFDVRKLLEEIIKTSRVSTKLRTEEEVQKETERRQSQRQAPQASPDKLAEIEFRKEQAQMQMQQAQMEMEFRKYVADQQRAREESENAQQMNEANVRQAIAELQAKVKMEELALRESGSLGREKMKIDAENQRFNAEVAVKTGMGSGI